jgi:hypothetical protein
MPKYPDVKDLRRLINDTAIEVRAMSREFDKGAFITALHAKHGDAFTHEQIVYGFDEYAWEEGRHYAKLLEKKAGKRDPAQLPLPMDMAGLDIPGVLPIDRPGGKRTCVVTMHATLADCDAYVASIEGNINACMKRMTEFLAMVKVVRPIMEANPTMTVGMALQWLCDREQGAA